MEKMYLEPAEIAKQYIEIGRKKTHCPAYKLILLGILAGAFIALAAQGSNVAIHTIASVGLGKALAGAIFATGLMMVIITGAELFTGNTLIVISCLEKKSYWRKMLQNWFYVYLGNFVGSILIVLLIFYSGQLSFSGGLLGGFTIKVAAYKTGLSFEKAFFMGILCNILVCLAVWMATAAQDITGKLFAIFFPIWLFIASGFEHSIANMYYIPAGILAKLQPGMVEQAIALGVTSEQLSQLTWAGFLKNLLPVTLGNIVGGSLFVGFTYWASYLFQVKSIQSNQINNIYEQSGGEKHVVQK
ncbi:MAG TPA: formate/nitrite transporter family protein [Peptococcaceae bacterium]|nr:formate/nitrite transporter family protein [Peptococcaceae bacterium]